MSLVTTKHISVYIKDGLIYSLNLKMAKVISS